MIPRPRGFLLTQTDLKCSVVIGCSFQRMWSRAFLSSLLFWSLPWLSWRGSCSALVAVMSPDSPWAKCSLKTLALLELFDSVCALEWDAHSSKTHDWSSVSLPLLQCWDWTSQTPKLPTCWTRTLPLSHTSILLIYFTVSCSKKFIEERLRRKKPHI